MARAPMNTLVDPGHCTRAGLVVEEAVCGQEGSPQHPPEDLFPFSLSAQAPQWTPSKLVQIVEALCWTLYPTQRIGSNGGGFHQSHTTPEPVPLPTLPCARMPLLHPKWPDHRSGANKKLYSSCFPVLDQVPTATSPVQAFLKGAIKML